MPAWLSNRQRLLNAFIGGLGWGSQDWGSRGEGEGSRGTWWLDEGCEGWWRGLDYRVQVARWRIVDGEVMRNKWKGNGGDAGRGEGGGGGDWKMGSKSRTAFYKQSNVLYRLEDWIFKFVLNPNSLLITLQHCSPTLQTPHLLRTPTMIQTGQSCDLLQPSQKDALKGCQQFDPGCESGKS